MSEELELDSELSSELGSKLGSQLSSELVVRRSEPVARCSELVVGHLRYSPSVKIAT